MCRSVWSLFPDLPGQFALMLLALGLGLLVAPYLAGTDFGQIKIPNLSDRAKRISRVLGPVAFFVILSLFIPFLPPSGSTAPTHYVDTDAGFINSTLSDYGQAFDF